MYIIQTAFKRTLGTACDISLPNCKKNRDHKCEWDLHKCKLGFRKSKWVYHKCKCGLQSANEATSCVNEGSTSANEASTSVIRFFFHKFEYVAQKCKCGIHKFKWVYHNF